MNVSAPKWDGHTLRCLEVGVPGALLLGHLDPHLSKGLSCVWPSRELVVAPAPAVLVRVAEAEPSPDRYEL